MKKLFLMGAGLAIMAFTAQKAAAQDYQHALGVRLGSRNGVNFKTFLNPDRALDFNLNFRNYESRKDVNLQVLYEIHLPVQNAPGLKWYYGAGGSLGSRKYNGMDGDLFLSADGVIGLDYKVSQAPINLALDWRPRFVLAPDQDVIGGDFGLAVRFTF